MRIYTILILLFFSVFVFFLETSTQASSVFLEQKKLFWNFVKNPYKIQIPFDFLYFLISNFSHISKDILKDFILLGLNYILYVFLILNFIIYIIRLCLKK